MISIQFTLRHCFTHCFVWMRHLACEGKQRILIGFEERLLRRVMRAWRNEEIREVDKSTKQEA
jgi:hypothetical protein